MDQYSLGCMAGGLVGDAAGAVLEFFGRAITEADAVHAVTMPGGGALAVGPGQITDDGELMLALLHGLKGHHPDKGFPMKSVAARYREWLQSTPFDVGMTCQKGFGPSGVCQRVIDAGSKEAEASVLKSAEEASTGMEANGALMRSGVIAVWRRQVGPVGPAPAAWDAVAEHARKDACLSHCSKVCQDANAVFVSALLHLLSHPGDAEGAAQLADMVSSQVHPTVQSWIEDSKSSTISSRPCTPAIGHAKHAFTLALHLLRFKCPTYEQAILTTLRLGGDTDTNACIVGYMMGALHGFAGIPERMWRPVAEFDCEAPVRGYQRPAIYRARSILEPFPLA